MPTVDPQTATDIAARFFGYSGMILNLGATLSAVLLLLAVSSVPTQSRRLYMACAHGYPRKVFEYTQLRNNPSESIPEEHAYSYLNTRSVEADLTAAIRSFNQTLFRGNTEETILDAFGIASGWGLMLRHCILCFLGGCIGTFVHVAILLWMNESTTVAAVLMPVVFVGFVPPVFVYMFGMESKRCPQCAHEKYASPSYPRANSVDFAFFRANPVMADVMVSSEK